MIYALVYLGVGLALVLYATVRDPLMRPKTLLDGCTLLGIVVLWLPVVAGEALGVLRRGS